MNNQMLLLFLTLVTICYSKEEKQKALIISVDEEKPEETSAVISDLTLDEQSSARIFRTANGRQYESDVLQSDPIEKQLGYILLTPADLKRLQSLDGVSVDEPKHVTLPHSFSNENSQENYDLDHSKPRYLPLKSSAPYHSGYPPSPSTEADNYYNSHRENKYPLRPAPPLSSLSSSNNSLNVYTNYDAPNSAKYNSQSSSQYRPYSSIEQNKGISPTYDSGSSYERSKYGPNSYSSPGSSYDTIRKTVPSYGKSHSSQTAYALQPQSYEYHNVDKSHENYSPPYKYSEYESAQRDPYSSKHNEEDKFHSEPNSPGYKYPSNHKTSGEYFIEPNSNTQHHSNSPKHNSHELSSHSYTNTETGPYESHKKTYDSKPSPAVYDSHSKTYDTKPSSGIYNSPKKTYDIKISPLIYDSYIDPPTSNRNIKLNSYGSRTKYTPENLSHSNAYDSKHGYNEADLSEYSSNENHYNPPSNTPNSSYKTKPYYLPKYEISSKQRYYDTPKSSNSGVTGPAYRDKSYPSHDPHYYTTSSHKEPSSEVPYDSPISTYDNEKLRYSGKPPSTLHEDISKQGPSDLSTYNSYGNRKYPLKYKSLTSSAEDGDYSSSPVSSKSHTNYHGSSSPKNPEVTRFYENPPLYTGREQTYNLKYPEIDHQDTLPKHSKYGSSLSSKYPDEDSRSPKNTQYQQSYSPTYGSDPAKDKTSYFTSSELVNSHSAKKNYRPSRPAPLYDQYEQPRYPPLPEVIKESSEKSVPYTDYKEHSGERSANYRNNDKSDYTESYPPTYNTNSYHPPSSEDNRDAYYPPPNDSNGGPYSDHTPPEADDAPIIYTKTITKTYTKPKKSLTTETKYYDDSQELPFNSPNNKHSPTISDSSPNQSPSQNYPPSSSYSSPDYSSNHNYPPPSAYSSPNSSPNNKYPPSSSYSSPKSYRAPSDTYPQHNRSPTSNYPPSSSYSSPNTKTSTYTLDSDTYSGPHSYSSPGSTEYTYAKPLDNGEKKFKYYTENSEQDSSVSHEIEAERPKRVEGVVYRSRKTYPKLQSPRRHKSYLPYKIYDTSSAPAYEYKAYENAPEKNITKAPTKVAFKLKYKPINIEKLHKDTDDSTNYDHPDNYERFSNIPGEPGKDFPILKEIPHSHFSCDNRAPGFYADIENRCQVYYQCSAQGGVQSFLCPNGTVFNQVTFVCEWWYNVDCAKSEKHFSKNDDLYKPNVPVSNEHSGADNHHHTTEHTYPSDEYLDNYRRSDGNERISQYVKPLRTRRKNHSKVTYAT